MKKSVYILILFLVLSLSFVMAAENDSSNVTLSEDSDPDLSAIDMAYECLEDKVDGKCDDISSEEGIFTLLATGKCKSEVKADSSNDQCWPSSGCKIKTTAQAILALDSAGTSTSKAEEWLFEQNGTPSDVLWFLQIESAQPTTCTVSYSDSSYSVIIGADKKISSGAGSCLSLSEGGYWLRAAPSCYDEEFQVSCDQGFLTSLLYRRQSSSTIYISEKTNSASAEGTTTEKINSVCFDQGGSCNYEGTLWAALVLDFKGYDVSPYMPYLVTMAGDNDEFLPEAFLYSITGYQDFRTNLLLKQKSTSYWDESGDKFYDTAAALFPFQYENPSEKENAKEWLLEVQDKDGCWKGNTRNTAFLLYSLWPRDFDVSDPLIDCDSAGYYCMSEINCEGEIKDGYGCSGLFKCCSSPVSLDSCFNLGGEICSSSESCIGGIEEDASDTSYGEECCVGGTCEIPITQTPCESSGGNCRSFGCDSGEIESTDSCDDFSLTCCTQGSEPSGGKLWIWILLLLIILVIVAIIFRNKIRPHWFRLKSKFGGGKPRPGPGAPGRGLPPQGLSGRSPSRPRRGLPPPKSRPVKSTTPPKKSGELDSVLKKLRDMGK